MEIDPNNPIGLNSVGICLFKFKMVLFTKNKKSTKMLLLVSRILIFKINNQKMHLIIYTTLQFYMRYQNNQQRHCSFIIIF